MKKKDESNVNDCRPQRKKMTYPFRWLEVQVLDLAMLKERRQAYSIVGNVWLFSDYENVVLAGRVLFNQFFTV